MIDGTLGYVALAVRLTDGQPGEDFQGGIGIGHGVVCLPPAMNHPVKVAERIAGLSIGPGTDAASEMGPLITREHRDKVAAYVTGAAAEGATVVVDGTTQQFEGDGFFIGASLTRETLRSVGVRPLVQGVLLWISISSISLAYIFWVG